MIPGREGPGSRVGGLQPECAHLGLLQDSLTAVTVRFTVCHHQGHRQIWHWAVVRWGERREGG